MSALRFTHLPLTTPRLQLRALQPADAEALFEIFSDPRAMQYWSTPPWTTPQQAVERIEQDTAWLEQGAALRLAVMPHATPVPAANGEGEVQDAGAAVIGTVSLFAFDAASQRAEIGYMLAPRAWGRGLMQEALQALVTYAFGVLGLRRLEADIDPRNQRSARLLERLGFRHEGLLRERWAVAGEVSDSAMYGLLAREWRAAPPTKPA